MVVCIVVDLGLLFLKYLLNLLSMLFVWKE